MVGEGLRREPLRRTAKRTINDNTHVKRRTDNSFFTPFFTPRPYMSCYGSRISSAATEPKRQWPMKWRAFDNRVGKKATRLVVNKDTQEAVIAATRKAIVKVTRRAVPRAMTMAEDTKPLPNIIENNLKR